jgi:hypothetical protein
MNRLREVHRACPGDCGRLWHSSATESSGGSADRSARCVAANAFVRCTLLGLAGTLAVLPSRAVDGLSLHGSDTAAVESCVSGPAIRFEAGDSKALLDDGDRQRVQREMVARYPMLQRDGFEPSYIVLWRKAGSDWLYVTLLANGERPSDLCFTATFTAAAFEFTDALLRKYFALGAQGTRTSHALRRFEPQRGDQRLPCSLANAAAMAPSADV